MFPLRLSAPEAPAPATSARGPAGLVVLMALLTLVVAGATAAMSEEPAASPTPAAAPASPSGRDAAKPTSINKDKPPPPDVAKKEPVRPAGPAAAATSSPRPPSGADQERPVRFNDDDLAARYHGRPAPAEPVEAADQEIPNSAASPAGPAKSIVTPEPPKLRPARTPPPRPAPPQADPLKAYHDREANEKFRTEQVEALRASIAQAQSRLDYLNQRRLAVVDPLRIPPKAPEGEQVDPKLRPKELLEQLDAEIAAAGSALAELKTRLVTIETRFQKESGTK